MNFLQSTKKYIMGFRLINLTGELRDLKDWRSYYVDLMLRLSIILVPAGLILALPVMLESGSYFVILIDIAVIVFTVIFLVKGGILTKKVMFFVSLYTLVIVHLVSFGPSYARPGWIIFSAVTSSLIFGTPAAFITVGLNAVMLSILCFADFLELESWASTYGRPVMARVMFIVNMSLLSLASSLPVSVLLYRLEGSFRREKGLSESLIKESGELQNINRSLEHEINERMRADNEKERLQNQLMQVQKMESIGRLAGGIAHDYNNMLSVILGNTEMLLEDKNISGPNQVLVRDILSAGLRSADLTRQLLTFARRQSAKPIPLDLNSTVNGMMQMLKRLISGNIKLEWRPGNHVWKVRIDPSQVDQVLVNLIVNARDAIQGDGRIRIETSTVEVDESYRDVVAEALPGEYTMLTVNDTGSGMDRGILSNLFEPFFTTKPEGHGTGLGLATVYGIVHQNSGFINVYSEPGVGTTFRIYFPRCNDETGKAMAGEKNELPRGRETILIVEDEESVLNLTVNLLRKLGYTVLPASSTADGIKTAEEYNGKIHMLLSDVILPGTNVQIMSEKILVLVPGIKCLFMSGYTDDVIAYHGILPEKVQFIQKPFSLEALALRVRRVLDSE